MASPTPVGASSQAPANLEGRLLPGTVELDSVRQHAPTILRRLLGTGVIAPKAAAVPAWAPPSAKLQRADPLTQNLGHRWDENLRCRDCYADC